MQHFLKKKKKEKSLDKILKSQTSQSSFYAPIYWPFNSIMSKAMKTTF